MAEFSLKEISKLRLDKQKAIKKGDLKQVALICNSLGEILSRNGKFSESLSEHEEEKTACEALGDNIGVAVAHRKLGEVYCDMGDYATALWHQHKHLDLAREANNLSEEQRALATLGRTFLYQAESFEASGEKENQKKTLSMSKQAFIKSLAICEKLKDGNVSKTERMEMKARLFLNIGMVLELQNKTTQAIELYKQALHICIANELKEDTHRCYYFLTDTLYKHGQYREALKNANLALATAKLLKNKIMQFSTLNLKAQIMLMLQDFSSAKHYLLLSRKLIRAGNPVSDAEKEKLEADLKTVVRICWAEDELSAMEPRDPEKQCKLFERLGDMCSSLKVFVPAAQFYSKAIQAAQEAKMAERDITPLYYSLSATYTDLKQYQEAIESMRKELSLHCSLGNAKEAARTLINLASVEENVGTDYETLKKRYKEAFENAKSANCPRLMVDALLNLSAVQGTFKLNLEAENTREEVKRLSELYGVSEVPDSGSEEEDVKASKEEEDIDLSDVSDSGHEDSDEEKPSTSSRPRPRRAGRNVEKRNEKGETALHRACIAGNLACVRRLLQQGHSVNPRDNCGWLPLHEAANHDHLEIVALLLEYGAWVNDRGGVHCEGVTPLHDAASCGNIDVMKLLIEKGANVTAKTDKGETPLDCLRQWRKRAGRSIDPNLIVKSKKMEEELQGIFQRLGIETSETRIPYDDFAASLSPEPIPLHSDYEEDEEESEPSEEISSRPRPSVSSAPVQSYVEAMENLGSKRKGSTFQETKVVATKPRRALVHEEEIIDDWLEDDLKSQGNKTAKKRRLDAWFTTSGSRSKKNSSPTESTQKRTKKDTSVHNTSTASAETEEHMEDYYDEPPVFRPESPVYSNRSNSTPVPPNDTSEVRPRSCAPVISVKQTTSGNTRVKVRVLDKLLLIPVPEDSATQSRTISWLAEEAAKRYEHLIGVTPVLTLMTKDGALLSRDDLVKMVMDADEEVQGQVEKWHVAPPQSRYVDACHAFKANVNETVTKRMEEMEPRCILDLQSQALGPSALMPVTRALYAQHSLRELCLAANRMDDEVFKVLCEAFRTMPLLTHLELRANLITAAGLSQLAEILQTSSSGKPPLQNLSLLDLSFNPLGNAAASYLAVCLRLLPVSVLRLERCSMDAKLFEQRDSKLNEAINESSVRQWCLGYNDWTQTGIQLWLRHLRANYVSDISFTGALLNENQAEHLPRLVSTYVLQQESCCLTRLDLSRCHLTDAILEQLSTSFIGMTMLERVRLASNPGITWRGFLSMMKVLQTHNIPLEVLECSGCPKIWRTDSPNEVWETWTGLISRTPAIHTASFAVSDASHADRLGKLWEEQYASRSLVTISSLGREIKMEVATQ